MGFFSSWSRANDFDLTAEDLATCEGYVTVEAFRKLEAAKASARSDGGSSLFALARGVATRVMSVVAEAVDRAPVSGGTAATAKAAQDGAPVTTSVAAASSTAPATPSQPPTGDHIGKAA